MAKVISLKREVLTHSLFDLVIAFWYFTWQILYIFSAAILPYSAMKTTGYVVCHIPLVADRVSGHFPVAVFFFVISLELNGSASKAPSPAISGMADVFPAMMGVPQAIASSIGMPKLSRSDG